MRDVHVNRVGLSVLYPPPPQFPFPQKGKRTHISFHFEALLGIDAELGLSWGVLGSV